MITRFLLFWIHFYRKWISPVLGCHCRFFPSCSQYCEEAVVKKGATQGLFLSFKRMMRCHPFHRGGYDPVG